MDIIANKKIENLPFDKTILCVITEVTDEEEGIYEVSFSSNQAKATHFTAYAQEGMKYAEGDNVYVNVPQNDFSNQKTIISKYISDQATPINYIFPMDRFIHVKDLEYTKSEDIWINNEVGLKANGDDLSIIILNEASPEVLANKYDCLGISADFKTLLGSYKPLEGEYGLRFTFIGLKDGWDVDTSHLENYFVYKVDTFSNKEMYGMTYDYFIYSNQQKLINLQDFPYPIYAIKVEFYQNKDFKDIKGKPIPATINAPSITFEKNESGEYEQRVEGSSIVSLDKDLFIKNLTLSFGYLLNEVEDKELKLYTTSISSYAESKVDSKNVKHLKLRWIEQNEDGTFSVIDEMKDKWVEQKTEEETTFDTSWWDNKFIYLYKYSYGIDEIDEYAGAFWERIASWSKFKDPQTVRTIKLKEGTIDKYIYEDENAIEIYPSISEVEIIQIDKLNHGIENFSDPFNFSINIVDDDKNSAFARYKVIIVEKDITQEEGSYTTSIDFDNDVALTINPENLFLDKTYYSINPDGEIICESNEITFENLNEVAGKAAMALIDGLELKCMDDSNGIYRIYGEDNKITAQTNSRSMKIRANFNAINILGLNAGEANITWYYPKNNTMFVSPIDKTSKTIDVYKPFSEPLDANNLNQYYVKVDEQYYQLKTVTINETSAIGYERNGRSYVRAESQTVYTKEQEIVQAASWDENSDPNYYILTQTLNINNYGDSDSITPSNNEIVYTIDSFYASTRTNNTIRCKISRYGRDYWAEKEFFFGHQGNNGTNYAFDISLEREYDKTTHQEVSEQIIPFLKQGNQNFIKVKATLIYGTDEITDSNYLNKIKWKWEAISKNGEGSEAQNQISLYDSNFNLSNSPSGPYIYLKLNTIADLSKYYAILKAEIDKDIINITESTDVDNKTRNVTLSTYLPIGISANNNIETYIGGTSILYNDYGSDPVYYEGEHQLIGGNKSQMTWWFLNSDTGYNSTLRNSLPSNSYYPQMMERQERNSEGHTHEWFIRPTSIYFNNIDNTGRIIVRQGTRYNENDPIIFVQPIFIAQNAWGNQTINQWDGALKVDAENNYILSSMLGAGVKNSDNTFSGVLLGKVGTDYSAKTGIYGYGNGVQTYGFREDGTAFIGASGMGRIEFNTSRDEGVISGGRYTTIENGIKSYSNEYTMEINLSQGKIIGRKHKNDSSEDSLEYTFDAQANDYPLKIGKLNNEKFKVHWDGTLYATGAHFGSNPSSSGYWPAGDPSIEEILVEISESTKNKDESLDRDIATTNATVERHWEKDLLFNQVVSWPQEEYEQLRDTDNNLLYWNISASESNITTTQKDYLLFEGNTWKQDDSNRHLYWNVVPADSNTTTTPNNYPVKKKNSNYDYFVLTNKTYGSDATHKYYLSKDGSFTANNGIFSGVVTAYAGDFGGWSLMPGIMSYGYNISYHQDSQGNYWTGNFFTNPNTHQNADIGEEPFITGTNGNTASFVSVGLSKAFIYLRNSGNGININNFAGNSYTGNSPSSNDISKGYLQNIIFSLGRNFAVDKDGQLFANSGTFSGTITAVSGKIGGWSINENTLTATNNNFYLNSAGTGTTTINGTNRTSLVIYAGSKFGVTSDGTLYANGGEFSGTITATSGKIGGLTLNNNSIVSTNVSSSGNGYLYINPNITSNVSSTTAFQVGSNFIVKADGSVYANALYLGANGSTNTVESVATTATTNTIKNTLFNGGDIQNIITYVKSDDNFVYFDVSAPEGSSNAPSSTDNSSTTFSKNYFKVAKNGLLTATNAVIYGTIYSSAGDIGGWKIQDGYIYNTGGPTTLDDYSHSGVHLNSGRQANTIPGINIVLETPSNNNKYTTDYTQTTTLNPFQNIIALIRTLWSNLFGSNTIQKITPKFFIREVNQPNIWSGLNQYGLIISDTETTGKIKSFYGKDLMVGGNAIFASKTYINQLAGTVTSVPKNETSPFDYTAGWNQTITYYNSHYSSSSNTQRVATTAIGLNLNTTSTTNDFWRNSFYTILKNYNPRNNSSYYYPMQSDFVIDNYVAFIRGFGTDSSQPSQVYLGIKKYTSSIDADITTDNWDNDANYLAYIRYNGEASFSAITLDGSRITSWPSGSSSVTLNGSSNSSPNFYAPTSSGTPGQFLTSNGSNKTPVWASIDGLNTSSPAMTSFAGALQTRGWWGSSSATAGTVLSGCLWFNDSTANSNSTRYKQASIYGGTDKYSARGINEKGNAILGDVAVQSLWIDGVKVGRYQQAYTEGGESYSYVDYSDVRLKQNLQKIINLDLYDNLIPYSFEWKENNKKSYGFIAQDIEKLSQQYENNSDSLYYTVDNIHPDYIEGDKEYRINYQQFHALHVAKNQQQDARIQSLESEVASLRAELEQLKREKGGN